MTAEFVFLFNQALQLFQEGRIDSAGEMLNKALRMQHKNPDALHLMGVIRGVQNRHDEAKTLLKKAAQLSPENGSIHFNLAKALSEIGRDTEALAHHQKASQLLTEDPRVWLNYGKSLDRLNRINEAVSCYEKALSIQPQYPEALTNLGGDLYHLKRYEESLSCLGKALALNPGLATAWYYQGNVLFEIGSNDQALHCYDQAIAIKPDYIEVHNNRGALLYGLNRRAEAMACFDQVISIDPSYAMAYFNRGNGLRDAKQFELAIASYDKALALAPDMDSCYGLRVHARMHLCSWTNFHRDVEQFAAVVDRPQISEPFTLLPVLDEPDVQKKCAEKYVQKKIPLPAEPYTPALGGSGPKLKVGYFSSDFRNHPVGHLAVGLFEAHDRDRFEIYGFGLLPRDDSPLGDRLVSAFDHFVDLSEMSLPEAVQSARALGLDIGIDLNGHTRNCRTGLFSHRVAPIQINFLGYPGTMGASFIDYIVADPTLIPEAARPFYSEKIACLPHSFLVNSYADTTIKTETSREVEGLPPDSFIFCCFNNNYKITPAMFDVWMKILRRVEKSILLLYVDTSMAMGNLRREAQSRGVDADRLYFASAVDRERYFARYQVVDLYLDTYPYNAGTTACDALWVGLPVLTSAGTGFQSRMAASLLTALGLSEMIASSPEEYENLAVHLATAPGALVTVKEKLARNRSAYPLFDTKLYTTHLENAYMQMHERQRQGLAPDHIYVSA